MPDRFTGPTVPPEPLRYPDEKTGFLHAVRLRETARRAGNALATQGIHAVVLKGVALAALDAPPPGERHSADVDLLVPRPSFDRAVHALTAAGWKESLPRPEHGISTTLRDHPELAPVDLHIELLTPGRARLDGADVLLRAIEPPRWLAKPLRIPGPLDLFAHLAAHASYNLAVEARRHHLDDLRRLTAAARLDARALTTHLARTGVRGCTAFVLEFGDFQLDSTLEAVRDHLAPSLGRAARALASHALGTPAHSASRRILHLVLADRPVTALGVGLRKRLA